MKGQRFSLLPMPILMVFTLALAHILPMVPNCIPIRAVVRLVGFFCSVTADLQLRTGAYGPVTLDNATVPLAELLAVIFLVERSVGPIHIHSDCKYVCSGKNKLAQRTERGAHVTLWTRLQQALSRHQGAVEIFWCKAHITWDNFHHFAMTPEILVGNAVADALSKKGASVFLAANDWVKMDQITWAVQQRIYATNILAGQAAPRSASAHPEDVLLAARRVRKSERTILENAYSHSLVPVGKGYHCHVCENSTRARGALDRLRNTICTGPPSSHPSVPVRVGHQMLVHLAQYAAGKKSRAIGLVNECPGCLTRAGRDVLARVERGLSPKASADWPLMRDTVSVNNDLKCKILDLSTDALPLFSLSRQAGFLFLVLASSGVCLGVCCVQLFWPVSACWKILW